MKVDPEKIKYLEQLPYTAIPLHGERGKGKYVLVDGDFDGAYFDQYSWELNQNGYVVRIERREARYIYLHREVGKPRPGEWAVFLNGNKLDCRSRNIWPMSPKEAIQGYRRASAKPRKKYVPRRRRSRPMRPREYLRSINKYRGVRKDFNATRWRVMFRGEHVKGSFTTPEQAARVYDHVAYQYWGNDALPILNFPEDYLNK